MKEILLFVDKEHRFYYLAEEQLICESCSKPMKMFVHIRSSWKKKDSKIEVLCDKCVMTPNFAMVTEYKSALVISKWQIGLSPVVIHPPTLVTFKDRDVFSVADDNTVPVGEDLTKLSGRTPSIKGAQIGNFDKELIKEKDKDLSEKEGVTLLDDIFTSVPISYDKKKKIEEKKDG